MSEIKEALLAFMQQQQAQLKVQQEFFIQQQNAFAAQLSQAFASSTITSHKEMKTESLASGIMEFTYDPENGLIFDAWFIRYEGLFNVDARYLDDAAKVRLLLRKLNTTCHKQYVDYILPSQPKDFTFEDTVKKLKQMFGKKISLFNQRYNCMNTVKFQHEDFIAYAAQINKKCEDFQISKITANQFKCLIFVCGLRSPIDADIRIKLLNLIDSKLDTLTIEDLTVECQRLLNLKADTSLVQNAKPLNVAAIQTKQKQSKTAKYSKNKKSQNLTKQGQKQPATPCWFCGQLHYSKDCTYKNHLCKNYNTIGHKDGYCNSSKKTKSNSNNNDSTSTKTITAAVNQINETYFRKYVDVTINSKTVKLQLDTGSDITIISEDTWKLLGQPQSKPSERIAKDASGNPLHISQEVDCTVSLNNVSRQLRFYVTPNTELNLLGLDWLHAFDLWHNTINSFCNHVTNPQITASRRQALQQRFPNVFSPELGCCTKTKITLHLKTGAKPVFRPKWPVAYSILPLVEAELERLKQAGIISPVSYLDWAAPIVVVRKKNGQIRICADFSTGLNDFLEQNHHPLPHPNEIFAKLSNCKYFSQIDLSDAFLQIQVDENSKHLLTINTHRGLFVYNRLPFGVTVAPGEFQAIVDAIIAGLDKVFAYIDHLVVGGSTIEEHDRNLNELFKRVHDYGLHVHIEKCNFFATEINYLGYIIDGQGLHPDPKKISAIVNLPAPSDLTTLQ
ncbi:uncharacterized protein K02A2.6-like [Mycetomoellerius zeteki]|uniref:uncharacterized protein K02A2.6-like n=1 Tax=Mycetomoellerius zeteki TaxID=64791 RepID=UPI00084E56E1|nr:PREDICTED: uncharacterized protein K02A2.6-like [Trachymyrmex zeteki]